MILFLLFVAFTWLAGVTGLLVWFYKSAGPDDKIDYTLVTLWPLIFLVALIGFVFMSPYYLVKFLGQRIEEWQTE